MRIANANELNGNTRQKPLALFLAPTFFFAELPSATWWLFEYIAASPEKNKKMPRKPRVSYAGFLRENTQVELAPSVG